MTEKTILNPYIIKYHLLESRKELEQLEAYYDALMAAVDIDLSEKDEEMIFQKRRKLKMIIGKINMELQND